MSYNIEETDIQDLAVAKRKLRLPGGIETLKRIRYNVAIFFMSRPKCGKLFEQSLETGKEKALCLWSFFRPAVPGKEGCAAGDRELRVKTRRRKRNRY
ncbi:hypothetical protein EBB54_00675 [Schaedlerella arabinosiphila]|jgi:hypothetical protein|uniref:Uncharacterized protein n=1 Tax=Schaedlerella arabinosiphila TaxID=2044587 RepID=A0A426DSE2_9FIRM|nr:hypothetical protein EBB54_30240 [Schaedlerella arabinosiphila]RRK37007.1 hypothetical protein EBB54_00675 [Schaedlerella arabinosiphila]